MLGAQGAHLADSVGADEGAVAGEHHHGAVEAGERVLGRQHCVGRAPLLRLHDHLGIALHKRRHLLAAMAHHGDNAVGSCLLRRLHSPAHERPAERSSFHETPFYSQIALRLRLSPMPSV